MTGPTSDPADETLMHAFAQGDTAAFEPLFERHRRSLFTFLLHQCRSRAAAEDLFQDVFLRLVRARRSWTPSGRFRSWLYAIARNALVDARRRDAVRASEDAEAGTDPLPTGRTEDPAERASARELGQRVAAALERLPAEQREVFLLRERAGLEFAAIAELTGEKLATVKSRMRYALAGLRRLLAGELAADPDGEAEVAS